MEKKGEFRVLKPAQLYKEELQEENIIFSGMAGLAVHILRSMRIITTITSLCQLTGMTTLLVI